MTLSRYFSHWTLNQTGHRASLTIMFPIQTTCTGQSFSPPEKARWGLGFWGSLPSLPLEPHVGLIPPKATVRKLSGVGGASQVHAQVALTLIHLFAYRLCDGRWHEKPATAKDPAYHSVSPAIMSFFSLPRVQTGNDDITLEEPWKTIGLFPSCCIVLTTA